MPRAKKNRKIQMAPHYCGFIPQGLRKKCETEIFINLEEYESINLCDYEILTQAEAAKMMNVSRPTFTRIYESARRKIAKAFIEARSIRFEGGCVDIASWYKCATCGIVFTIVDKSHKVCPLCKGASITENKHSYENSNSGKKK